MLARVRRPEVLSVNVLWPARRIGNNMENDITEAQFAQFGKRVAAILGTSDSWGGDELAAIGEVADRELGRPVGSDNEPDRVAWRRLATAVDIDFDRDDVCRVDECLASLDDGEGQDGFCGTHADERFCTACEDSFEDPEDLRNHRCETEDDAG